MISEPKIYRHNIPEIRKSNAGMSDAGILIRSRQYNKVRVAVTDCFLEVSMDLSDMAESLYRVLIEKKKHRAVSPSAYARVVQNEAF